MANPQPTPVPSPSSLAGMKRKASAANTVEQTDDGSARPELSNAKTQKRAKVTHGDADVLTPTATQFTKAINKAKKQSVAGSSVEPQEVDMVDAPEAHSVPSTRIVKPRKKKAAPAEDQVNRTAAAAPKPKNRQPANNTPVPRRKKTASLPVVPKDDNEDMENAGDNSTSAATQQPKKRALAKKTPVSRSSKTATLPVVLESGDQDMEDAEDNATAVVHQDAEENRSAQENPIARKQKGETENDEEEMSNNTQAAPTGISGPISLLALATGGSTTGKDNDDAQSSGSAQQPVPSTATEHKYTPAAGCLPAPDVSGVNLYEYFTVPLPPKVVPWNLNCPQPYQPYGKDVVDCPIDWTKFPGVDRDAYELQAHWTPNRRTDEQAQKLHQAKTGTALHTEGFRKRFKKANKAIFEATGVYFLHKSLGLKEYGIPADAVIDKKMRETKSGPHVNFVEKVPKIATILETDEEPDVDSTEHLEKASRKMSIPDVEVSGAVEELDVELLSGLIVTHLIEPEIFASLQIANGVYPEDLAFDYFTEATFNRWHSCMCFGARHTFPKRVYKLSKVAQFEKIVSEPQKANDSPKNPGFEQALWDSLLEERSKAAQRLQVLAERKLKKPDGKFKNPEDQLDYVGDKHMYTDEGKPPVTIQTILDTYCMSQFMGTTGVSDMILDEIHMVLEDEKAIDARFAQGNICDAGDYNKVVRLQDLLPEDIEKLWLATKLDDPIRHFLLGLFTGLTLDECKRLSAAPHEAGMLWSGFLDGDCQEQIAVFVNATDPVQFCEAYHNHGPSEPCFRSTPPAALSKHMIDDTLDDPNIHKLEIGGVWGYRVINATGAGLDMDRLQDETPSWDWKRVKSINSWIVADPNGPQTRQPHPVYFERSSADMLGRYPSHPGYKRLLWEDPVAANAWSKDDWNKAKRFDIPDDGQRVRAGKGEFANYIFFEIEDDDWIPPPNFEPELVRPSEWSYHEFQGYRRWQWVQKGNKIPLETCYRFRPFNVDLAPREDTFTDAPRQR